MPRRLSLLVSAALLCAAVAIVVWLRGQDEQKSPHVSVAPTVNEWDLEPSDGFVNPGNAIATIHAVRSQFGSVLTNSALDVPDSPTSGVGVAEGPRSFDDFLWAAAGVTDPSRVEVDAASSNLTDLVPLPADGLAQSMRETATLLVERAQRAEEMGDVAQQQRFFGLATLLRAEADVLARARQADR